MFNIKVFVFLFTATVVTALEPFDNFSEGACFSPKPIKATRQFVDTLKYISGGTRYNFYRFAAAQPNYPTMREEEIYYDACFSRNTSTVISPSTAAIFGFGRILFPLKVVTRPGIYLEAIPTDPAAAWDTVTDTVTLTDHKSFAVLVQCWTGSNKRGWAVVTLTPHISESTRKIIEDHVKSLGFNEDNFMFLRYDSCRRGNANPSLNLKAGLRGNTNTLLGGHQNMLRF